MHAVTRLFHFGFGLSSIVFPPCLRQYKPQERPVESSAGPEPRLHSHMISSSCSPPALANSIFAETLVRALVFSGYHEGK